MKALRNSREQRERFQERSLGLLSGEGPGQQQEPVEEGQHDKLQATSQRSWPSEALCEAPLLLAERGFSKL